MEQYTSYAHNKTSELTENISAMQKYKIQIKQQLILIILTK